jgi:RimJ/RimL family protein N-acetyltransferase
MRLALRQATAADEARLLAWRNDPQTRAQAFSSSVVEPDEHHRWLRTRLDDHDTVLAIAELDGQAVGTVRLDRRDRTVAELSITVAPEHRGRGLAKEAIALGVSQAREMLGASTVIARIKRTNTPSLRAFTAAGFSTPRERDGVIEVQRTAI